MKLTSYRLLTVFTLGAFVLLPFQGCKAEPAGRKPATQTGRVTGERDMSNSGQASRRADASSTVTGSAGAVDGLDATVGNKELATATFGTGCFWCTEAVFESLKGVVSVVVGYMGGKTPNPTYKDVCSGRTGHAEVARITYDPGVISYEALLDVFWKVHDPTSLNRQGADVGTQYRSAIFYYSEAQKAAAEKAIRDLQSAYRDPVVTEVTPASTFYAAETYHQDYFKNNANAPYCRLIIAPKLKKLSDMTKQEKSSPPSILQ